MIATWMLYAMVVGVLLAAAARSVEAITRALRRPSRFAWCLAVAGSLAWPVFSLLRPARDNAPAIAPMVTLPFTVVVPDPVATTNWSTRVDIALVAMWVSVSLFLLFRLARAVVSLRRRRSEWQRHEVDGMEVRLSSDVGPAVVGLRSMDVVLPEWILSLDRPLRALVLKHEDEHRMARDPHILFGAAIAVALMPWNLALWWQVRRLRHAIEVDCDARVLRGNPRPERYGLLLLAIAQRRSAATSAFAPMLTEPTTQLERRIDAMRASTKLVRLTAFAGAAVAVAALAVACSLQSPDKIVGPRPSASLSAGPTPVNASQTFFEFQVEQAVQPRAGNPSPRYPDMLRSANVEGEVLAQFVVDTTGRADMSLFKVLKSTHDLFTNAVMAALPNMLFKPAEVGGRKVKQLVQMPFQFDLNKGISSEVQIPQPPEVVRGLGTVRRDSTRPLFVYTDPASLGDSPAARYPDMLRAANVEGEVVAQFVVGEDGRPDMSTFKVQKSTHDLFTQAVRNALEGARLKPQLDANGRPVRKLVQMPYKFSLSKE